MTKKEKRSRFIDLRRAFFLNLLLYVLSPVLSVTLWLTDLFAQGDYTLLTECPPFVGKSIVRLVGQVVRVSLETVRLVAALPEKFSG